MKASALRAVSENLVTDNIRFLHRNWSVEKTSHPSAWSEGIISQSSQWMHRQIEIQECTFREQFTGGWEQINLPPAVTSVVLLLHSSGLKTLAVFSCVSQKLCVSSIWIMSSSLKVLGIPSNVCRFYKTPEDQCVVAHEFIIFKSLEKSYYL